MGNRLGPLAGASLALKRQLLKLRRVVQQVLNGVARYGMFGDCAGRYRLGAPATERVRSSFDVDMSAFIAERGADAAIIGLQPPPCPRCGSARTELRLCVLG